MAALLALVDIGAHPVAVVAMQQFILHCKTMLQVRIVSLRTQSFTFHQPTFGRLHIVEECATSGKSMDLLSNLSAILGTNPATFVVLSLLAAACSYQMNKLHQEPGMAVLHFPLLLLGALLTDDLAVALGLYQSFDAQLTGGWSWDANWSKMMAGLPYVLVTGTIGMCLTAVGLLFLARKLRDAP